MDLNIREAKNVEEIKKCLPVLNTLMSFLPKDQATLLDMVLTQQKEGYRMGYIEDQETRVVISIIGYRIFNVLYTGKTLYVDDICTLPGHTGKGYGGKLLDWVVECGRKEGCKSVDLDSGPTRHDAHRLYLNHGFKLTRHHFHMDL